MEDGLEESDEGTGGEEAVDGSVCERSWGQMGPSSGDGEQGQQRRLWQLGGAECAGSSE